MRAAIYEPATGKILRTVTARTEGLVAQQVRPGETWAPVADDVEDTTHRIVDGVAVPIEA